MRSFWMYERRLYVGINSVAVVTQPNNVNVGVRIDPCGENSGTRIVGMLYSVVMV
jgi:hypothetical protein